MTEYEPQYCFEHIDKLAYEIGPRLAGSDRSEQATEYIKSQFESYGLDVRFQNFDFVKKILKSRAKIVVLLLVFLIAPFLSWWISFVGLVAGYSLVYVLPKIMPKKVDRNVVGTLRPKTGVERRVVLGAHYDSATAVKNRRWSFIFGVGVPILLIFFLFVVAVRYFVGFDVWLVLWGVLAVPFVLICSIPFWNYDDLVSPGAEDNASGISVLLEVARVISEDPPENTEIRFVAFGGEEQGLYGSREFASRTVAPDYVLNLDSLGSGESLALISGNSVVCRKSTSDELNESIEEKWGISGVWAPFSGHDHIPFLDEGMKATTLSSYSGRINKVDGFLESFFGLSNVRTDRHSQIHTVEDVPEMIRLENIRKAGEIILDLLRSDEN